MAIGKWGDRDILYGSSDWQRIRYAIELRPDAFDALRVGGYLYTVDAAPFHHDRRLSMPDELISSTPVDVRNTEVIKNAYDEIKRLGDVKLITYDVMLSRTLKKPSCMFR